MKLKYIPNILSVIRIILVFVFVYVLFVLDNAMGAIIVFLLAGATDIIDGFLARKFNWITDLGKILDPVADKMMQCTVLVCLCIRSVVPFWFVLPFFFKELATLIIGLLVIKRRNIVVVSKWYGKTAVCLFYITVVIAIVLKVFFDVALSALAEAILFGPAAIFALIAFGAYLQHYSNLKKMEIEKGKIKDVIKNGNVEHKNK